MGRRHFIFDPLAWLAAGWAIAWGSPLAARDPADPVYYVEAEAKNKAARDQIVSLGIAIDGVLPDSVTFLATQSEINSLRRRGIKLEKTSVPVPSVTFPANDQAFHTYDQTRRALEDIEKKHPDLAKRFLLGKSVEGRELVGIRISANPTVDGLATSVFVGCHHAREHLSVEVPLRLAQYLVEQYDEDLRVHELLDTREVWIIPMLNPDGAEYDIVTGRYQSWRKNRKVNSRRSYGVDLNRNYGTGFGGAGSSASENSETYRGPSAFSEPETQAVRDFLRARKRATVLLTFHTYGELILWPYGHTDQAIADPTDRRVFETMARKMAGWNHYKPLKSSALYLAAGDFIDWAYEELKIFGFTFEMSPGFAGSGGFYPGASVIEPAFRANLEPALYLIQTSIDPYGGEKPKDRLGFGFLPPATFDAAY